jgi:hypothetical protein
MVIVRHGITHIKSIEQVITSVHRLLVLRAIAAHGNMSPVLEIGNLRVAYFLE